MTALLSREGRCSQRGFALAEIVVAVTALAILIGASVPLANKVVMYKARQATSAELSELREGAGAFFQDLEALPNSINELLADPGTPGWTGPYLNKTVIRKDPWGNDFQYRAPGQNDEFDLWSLGADKRDGGEGEDRDVHSWD